MSDFGISEFHPLLTQLPPSPAIDLHISAYLHISVLSQGYLSALYCSMASQGSADPPVAADQATSQIPDRTQKNPADNAAPEGESKNAAKKAAKLAKQAADKAEKGDKSGVNKGIAKSEAKTPSASKSSSKKKNENAALIGIDVPKEEDFPGWYQQILTKGDMLDYYDVSGCFILKVGRFAM